MAKGGGKFPSAAYGQGGPNQLGKIPTSGGASGGKKAGGKFPSVAYDRTGSNELGKVK